MVYYATLCYAILYCTILYTILYCTILNTTLYYTMYYTMYYILYYTIIALYYTITLLDYAMLCYAILYYAMLCYAILYYAILYYAMLYYTILRCTIPYIRYHTIHYSDSCLVSTLRTAVWSYNADLTKCHNLRPTWSLTHHMHAELQSVKPRQDCKIFNSWRSRFYKSSNAKSCINIAPASNYLNSI